MGKCLLVILQLIAIFQKLTSSVLASILAFYYIVIFLYYLFSPFLLFHLFAIHLYQYELLLSYFIQ